MTSASEAPFWDHVEALRRSLLQALAIVVLGAVAAFFFHDRVFMMLTAQLDALPGSNELVIFSPIDGMMLAFKVSLWTGALLTAPAWLLIVVRFVMPGLEQHERRAVVALFILSLLFFFGGVALGLHVTIPIANSFLYEFNAGMGRNMWGLAQYVDYSLLISLGNGIAFELFVVLLFFIHMDKIGADALRSKRRHVIVGLLVVGAILTPPDVVTQCLVAAPLIALYEVAILYARLRGRAAKSSSDADKPL